MYYAETSEERSKTASILGALGDIHAFTTILTVINNAQENLSVRTTAMRALYELDSERAVEPLMAMLTSNSSRVIRAQSAYTLKETRQPATLVALLNALDDEATVVRAAAANSLQYFDDPQIIPVLQMMITREITRDDDFVDYLADMKHLPVNSIFAEWLPEELAQNAINFIQG